MTALFIAGQVLGVLGLAVRGWAGWQRSRNRTLVIQSVGSGLMVAGQLMSGMWGIAAVGVVSTARTAVYSRNRNWTRRTTVALGIVFSATSLTAYLLVDGFTGGLAHWLPVAAILIVGFFQVSRSVSVVKAASIGSGLFWCWAYTLSGAWGMLAGEAVNCALNIIALARIRRAHRTSVFDRMSADVRHIPTG